MTDLTKQFDAFQAIIKPAQRIILTTHVNPDGDGLGSEIALASYLLSATRDLSIINHSATPEFYSFLDPRHSVKQFQPEQHEALIRDSDVVIVVDTNQPGRLGSLREAVLSSKAKKIVIDHHLDPDPFADLAIIDDSAAATGAILYRLLEHLGGIPVSPEAATALYVAIMTDTGSFRFPKTDAALHRLVALLIESGADPVSSYQNIFEQAPVNRIQLLGHVLANIELHSDGRIAALVVPQQLFEQTHTSEPDVDRFVPYALGIKGVQIALMFTELRGEIKISFRSRGDIWINKLAQEFGGNGHKNAAGARVPNGRLDQVRPSVIQKAQSFLPS